MISLLFFIPKCIERGSCSICLANYRKFRTMLYAHFKLNIVWSGRGLAVQGGEEADGAGGVQLGALSTVELRGVEPGN